MVKGLLIKCFNSGIFIQGGGSRAVIEGNFIGNDPSVCSANDGVVVAGNNNTIGGQDPPRATSSPATHLRASVSVALEETQYRAT